jgi:DNA-binding NtrC family response regulator
MSLKLVVFRLKSGRNKAADAWLSAFEDYLERKRKGSKAEKKSGTGWNDIEIQYREASSCADAPWIGVPFILVGSSKEITDQLKRLSELENMILSDCGYYWILSDEGGSSLEDQFYKVSKERPIVLHWDQQMNFEVITKRLEILNRYPRLAGLSRGTHKIRLDISRITAGKKGPWSSVLILGKSGTGKEEVANTLYESLDFGSYKEDKASDVEESVVKEEEKVALQKVIAEILHAIQETYPSLKQKKLSLGTDGIQKVLSITRYNRKKPEKFAALSCGTFTPELVASQLFGIGPGIASSVAEKEGLLFHNSDGCIFLDDFDTALNLVQGPFLRIMATEVDHPAIFYRVGQEGLEKGKRATWAWLMFSTNANIVKLLRKGKLREDFIFRFKDRIIHIPPLRERLSDIPAIALRIWDQLWAGNEVRKRPLTPEVFRHLLSRETKWKGNVRALQALLTLMASMMHLPVHNYRDTNRIIDEIISPGSDFYDWVGIVLKDPFTSSIPTDSPDVREILDLDEGYDCLGSSKDKTTRTGSEQEARAKLSEAGRQAFEKVLIPLSKKREKGAAIRPRVRLARVIAYVARYGEINKHLVVNLCGIKEATAAGELKVLEEAGILQEKKDAETLNTPQTDSGSIMRKAKAQAKDSSQPDQKKQPLLLVYIKVSEMFQG